MILAVREKAEVVYGTRFRRGYVSGTKKLNYIANRILSAIARWTTRLPLTDMHTCFKLFETSVLRQVLLEERRFGFCPEITAKIARIPGLRFAEVDISYNPRGYQDGKKIGLKDGFRALYCIFWYRISPRRRWLREGLSVEKQNPSKCLSI